MGFLSRWKKLQEETARMISWWEFTVCSARLVNIHPKGCYKMGETIIPFEMEYIKQSRVHKVEC